MNNVKKIASHLSILYIESDLSLQSKVSGYLQPFFNNIYQAYDGLDGIKQYIKNEPNIVIMSLELDKKNAIEIIADMQELNEDINIIILSKQDDDFSLLQSFDMGLTGIFTKPIYFDNLDNILLNTVTNINNTFNKNCFKGIKEIFKKKQTISFINTYKGILIQNNGIILSIEDKIFTIKVPSTQLVTIQYEKFTIFKIDEDQYISATLLKIDIKNNSLTLCNPNYIDFKQRDTSTSRVVTDKDFKASAYINRKHLNLETTFISFNSAVLSTNNLNIKVDDKFDLTLGFELNSPSSLIKEKKFTKIFAKAKVKRIDKLKTKTNIIVMLEIQKAGENIFKKYLEQRKIELIYELKERVKVKLG